MNDTIWMPPERGSGMKTNKQPAPIPARKEKLRPVPVPKPFVQVGKPYDALKFKIELEIGEIVWIKQEQFKVRKIGKRDIILRSVRAK